VRLRSLFRRLKAAPPKASPVAHGHGGWISLIRESFPTAWQRNVTVSTNTALTYSAVFRCTSLISSDIAKMRMRLVRLTESGVWEEVESPAFSPILGKPNHFQTRQQFYANWVESKLIHGNTYVLKERDGRGVVVRLYVLDPGRVTVLVAPDSSVYYELRTDRLTGIRETAVTLPASEIIHDRWNTFFHPLVGVSPISACALAVQQGLAIQHESTTFFERGAKPGGVITAPTEINDLQAQHLKLEWESSFSGANAGRTAVLPNGMKYEPIVINPHDAQLIEQLRFTAEMVASVFGVPFYMIGGPLPTYDNTEALTLGFYSQCLQQHIEAIEALLDHGLGLGPRFGNSYGAEFDLSDLLRMDSKSKAETAREAIQSGVSPNEIRQKYFDLGPVPGGDTPYLQEQQWPLRHLAERPLPSQRPITEPTEIEPTLPTAAEQAEEGHARVLRAAIREFHHLADRELEHGWKN
jgi:HK97 family phage portal protein